MRLVACLFIVGVLDAYVPGTRLVSRQKLIGGPFRGLKSFGQGTSIPEEKSALHATLGLNCDVGNRQGGPWKVWKSLGQLVTNCQTAIKKFALLVSLLISLWTPRISVAATAAASGLFAAPIAAHAGVLRRYTKLSPMEKLASTPLFFVTNSGGSPYLQEDVQAGKPSQRIVVYFMSSEDANDYLNEMAQGSPQNVNEFRIKATSMEKVVSNIQKRKQSRKLGRFPIGTIYRIQPSSRQCENAERLFASSSSPSRGAKALKGMAIPMFSTKGLLVERSTGELLTPYYFAYEDLLDDWANLAKDNKEGVKMPSSPKVIVKDFTEVMCLSQGITVESVGSKEEIANRKKDQTEEKAKAQRILETVGIVPPRREIDLLRRYYRNQAGIKNEFAQARIIGPPR